MGPVIEARTDGRVRHLTLSRPDRLNALNTEVLEALRAHVAQATEDPSVGSILIDGAGNRAFCAGADLGELRGLNTEQALKFIRHGQRTMTAIANSPVPVVAAVGGYALGGGLELALSCHLVIASVAASFGLPEAKIGCIPGFGGTQRLLQATGKAPAMHLMLTGERVDADRAWTMGLVSAPPVPAADLADVAGDLARRAGEGSRTGNRSILEATRQAVDTRALEHEAVLAALAISSPDGQEGISAFADRRAANFAREQ